MKRDLATHTAATPDRTSSSPGLRVHRASTPGELIAAQRLRHRVFSEEMGALLHTPFESLDSDAFDAYCDHILVSDERTGAVVGTYRLLQAAHAAAIGRYYAESEFDLHGLQALRPLLGEAGRACVDPAWRAGAVLPLLWSGVARHVAAHGIRFVMGCASIDARDGGHVAAGVYRRLRAECAAVDETAARPRYRLPLESLDPPDDVAIPALIRGYVRAGATLLSEPAYDPDFRTADVLLLLDFGAMTPRYARRFAPPAAERGACGAEAA